jgi:hypothetical protein
MEYLESLTNHMRRGKMKLSEMMEKYGDIDIDEFTEAKAKADIKKITDITSELVVRLHYTIELRLRCEGHITISERYNTELIMDIFNNIHVVDISNNCHSIIKGVEALFLNCLYYITDSEHCYEGDDVSIDKFISSFEEECSNMEYFYDVVDDVEDFIKSLEVK